MYRPVQHVRVIPAILTEDPKALPAMLDQAAGFTRYVQVDIMDGRFVPSRSIAAGDLAAAKTDLLWEAHLMVRRPDSYLEDFQKAGANKVIFHYEATPLPRDTIVLARELGLGVGLAVSPETGVREILPLVGEVDSILFLTVHPGFYGARFLPEVLDKVAEFRAESPDTVIGVDGGISDKNIRQIVEHGVNDICVGSAIFKAPDPGEAYRHLDSLAQEALKRIQT